MTKIQFNLEYLSHNEVADWIDGISMCPQHIPMCSGSLLPITMPLVAVTACFTVPSPSLVSLWATPSSRIDSLQATEMVQHFLLSIRHTTNGKIWKKVIY